MSIKFDTSYYPFSYPIPTTRVDSQHPEYQYLSLLKLLLEEGKLNSPDTDDYQRYGIDGYIMRFPMANNEIPFFTTKKLLWQAALHEMFWFISGETNIQYLKDNKVNIWDIWANKEGDVGPLYGYQWRHWHKYDGGKFDQLANLEQLLRKKPMTANARLETYRVDMLPLMSINPCHTTFSLIFYRGLDKEKPDAIWCSGKLNQRSCDVFLGVPFNVAQYAMFLRLICDLFDFIPLNFVWSGDNVHLYENHFDQAKEQLTREPYPFPTLKIIGEKPEHIWDYTFKNLLIDNYQHHPFLKAEVSAQGNPGKGVKM